MGKKSPCPTWNGHGGNGQIGRVLNIPVPLQCEQTGLVWKLDSSTKYNAPTFEKNLDTVMTDCGNKSLTVIVVKEYDHESMFR